jgi:hypothetical protein
MPLVFMRAVPQFTHPVEEYRPCQSVFRLSFIDADMDASPQFDTVDVLEQEQRPLNLAKPLCGARQGVSSLNVQYLTNGGVTASLGRGFYFWRRE